MIEPKILFIDIETFPLLAYLWGVWEQNALSVTRRSIICCYSAKWLGGKQVTRGLPDYKGYKKGQEDDSKLVKELWDLLDQADIVVAQNGDNFDIKKMNTRFTFHKMSPPSPYKTVDTLKVARNIFGFESNKLDDLGKYLEIGEKTQHSGFKLWQGCMAGDRESWRLMKKYNAQDVLLLEKIYNRFLPWIKNHPNVGMFTDKMVCPKCGSGKLQARGYAWNNTTKYHRVQCQDCGGWARATKNVQETRPIVNIN